MLCLLLETGLVAEEWVNLGLFVGFGVLTVSWFVTNVYRRGLISFCQCDKCKTEKTHHCMFWLGLHESTVEYPPKIPFFRA